MANLYDENTQDWKREEIRALLGPNAEADFAATVRKSVQNPIITDRLIWKANKSGSYTTKEGYRILEEPEGPTRTYGDTQRQVWRRI